MNRPDRNPAGSPALNVLYVPFMNCPYRNLIHLAMAHVKHGLTEDFLAYISQIVTNGVGCPWIGIR